MATALDLYQSFVTIIDQAAADKNISAVPEAAQAAGMVGTEMPRGMGHRWDFTFTDQAGSTLLVHARWWDPSQAFSIRPDIHVMSAELKSEGFHQHHERRYEE